MNQNFTFNQSISLKQIKGMFNRKNKMKIAVEEYIQNEINYQVQPFESLKNTRVLIVESLILRPNSSISAFWYEITEENIWVILSYPIIIKLDHPLLNFFIKFIILTLNKYTNNEHKSLQDAELSTFENYIDEMTKIRSEKGKHLADKLKQVLFLLVNQFYKSKISLIEPQKVIPPSDKLLRAKLDASLSRLRSNFSSIQFNNSLSSIKLRIIPYLFQDIIIDKENPLRIKLIHSLLIKNNTQQNMFSVILISTQLLESLDLDSELLDILLSFEIISIENALKYNRGLMEREIYSIVSQESDASESALYKYFSKEMVSSTKEKLTEIYKTLIFQKKTPIIKVYE